MQTPSSILYRSPDNATVVLDIPRSLEESQVPLGLENSALRRIYSSAAPTAPYSTPEPASGGPCAHGDAAAQIAALMTAEHLSCALKRLASEYDGPYCLPRQLASERGEEGSERGRENEKKDSDVAAREMKSLQRAQKVHVPPGSVCLDGSIRQRRRSFLQRAPKFNLIVLDPPWPNRSARRKKTTTTTKTTKTTATSSYKTVRNLEEIRKLLCAIPVSAHLVDGDDGLVAVWITNKPRAADLVSGPGGLFEEWGLELVAEWTWLKVTAAGQPLYPLDSAWRKPWERLLVAKRVGRAAPTGLASRTVVAVPDLHSRKPSLRGLFADILGVDYRGLEIFARGLTAGWWSWGDEVLKFQQPEHWHRPQDEKDGDEEEEEEEDKEAKAVV